MIGPFIAAVKEAKKDCPCDCLKYPHSHPCFECHSEHGDWGMEEDLP